MRKLLIAAFVVICAFDALGQVKLCRDPRTGSFTTVERVPCERPSTFTYLCDMLPNEPCEPPATFAYRTAPIPFNAPVRFGGAVTEQGVVKWLWIKAGEPPRACSPDDRRAGATVRVPDSPGDAYAYEKACNTPIGAVLYKSSRFVVFAEPQQ